MGSVPLNYYSTHADRTPSLLSSCFDHSNSRMLSDPLTNDLMAPGAGVNQLSRLIIAKKINIHRYNALYSFH